MRLIDLVQKEDPRTLFLEMIRLCHFNIKCPQNMNVYVPNAYSEHGFIVEDKMLLT